MVGTETWIEAATKFTVYKLRVDFGAAPAAPANDQEAVRQHIQLYKQAAPAMPASRSARRTAAQTEHALLSMEGSLQAPLLIHLSTPLV